MNPAKKNRGYHLVDPGLTRHGLFSNPDASLNLSDDDRTRCLAYIIERLPELAAIPEGAFFEIIPLRYHNYGSPYPCIGMYTEGFVNEGHDWTGLSLELGDRVEAFIRETGLRRLLELSAGETLRWQDVLDSFGDDGEWKGHI